jgi:16S rRNA (guanine527-N7)-methyltransferase
LRVTGEQRALFGRFRELLIAESSRYNLTSLRDPDAIENRHFAESLSFLEAIESAGAFASPAVDIGTGAGFPGLAIKIVRPHLELTLIEATGKKAEFLEKAVAALGLDGVTVVNARAETAGNDPMHRVRYQLAMARAVAPLRVLVELALPLLCVGGHLAAQKGSGADREVRESTNALTVLGGEVVTLRRFEAPGAAVAPALVLVRKVTQTPDGYPRRPGIPTKRPL